MLLPRSAPEAMYSTAASFNATILLAEQDSDQSCLSILADAVTAFEYVVVFVVRRVAASDFSVAQFVRKTLW